MVSSKINLHDPLVSVQGQNEEQRPSRLSTRSVQSKIYDPLISVQGQNEEQRPSRLSSRSVQSKITTLSSQYKVSLRYATLSCQYKVSAFIYTLILLSCCLLFSEPNEISVFVLTIFSQIIWTS